MSVVLKVQKLGFPWITQDPFLFCVHHLDFYPKGNKQLGPDAPLTGRNIGNDFVIKDGWRMYHGEKVPGFPSHPHRGFETVTFVLQGMVDHADSNAAAGRYGNGDVQWMTAGKGMQHSEMFPLLNSDKENTLELFQIWLNLPSAKKFVEPDYKMLWAEDIPKISFPDTNKNQTELQLVTGDFNGEFAPSPTQDSWASDPNNEVAIWLISMEENGTWELSAAKNKVNRALYFFDGESIVIDDVKIQNGYGVFLDASEKTTIRNGKQKSRLLLLQGKPINEPVAHYGPFVMNSQIEIQQAFSDYQKTHFGGWPWSRNDVTHGKDSGRFAKFSDGSEIRKE